MSWTIANCIMSENQNFPELPSASYQPYLNEVVEQRIEEIDLGSNHVSLAIKVQAAWAIVVAHLTLGDDILFGVARFVQQATAAGTKVAKLSSTESIRTRIDWKKTVMELFQDIADQTPTTTSSKDLGPNNLSSSSEKNCSEFRTLLLIQDPGDYGHTGDARQVDSAGASIALILECQLEMDGLWLRISFDSVIIEVEQMKRIVQQLRHVLQQVCVSEHSQTKLCDIETASEQDLRDIWSWNATVPEAVEACVHDMIADTIQKQPDAPAICAWDGELTYGQLDDYSKRLAHCLVKVGVGPEELVVLCFEKSMWTPVAMLAVMKAGGASVALDSTLPEERLLTIVHEVAPRLVLASAANTALAGRLTSNAVVVVDDKNIASLKADNTAKLPTVVPSNKLYVVFTSGSTGTPKGAIITHRNFASAIVHQHAALNYQKSSRVFDFASYAFDAIWSSFLRTMCAGGCLCVPSERDRIDDVSGAIERLGVNFASLTPTVGYLLDEKRISRLEKLLFAGEKPNRDLLLKWMNFCPTSLAYGPAECTVMATHADLSISTYKGDLIGVGYGLNTWIVDIAAGECIAPIGAVGELWLEGPLVGQGYLNDQEKTADVFVEDPPWLARGVPGHPGRGGRLYRTGDLVRYNTDGTLTFVKRKDDQVKIRGQRVELGEVEHHMRRNIVTDREFHATAEVVRPKGSDNATLVAFLSISEGETLAEEELRAAVQEMTLGLDNKLAEALPSYMVPSAFIPLATLPMTVTGKTDRRRLREIGCLLTIEELAAMSLSRGEARPPETTMERKLQDLWALVIKINASSISANDSFLRLGGDSIGAMRLVAAARDHGLSLTVADVLRRPRLYELARIMEMASSSRGEEDVIAPYSLLKAGVGKQAACERVAALCDVNVDHIEDVFPCTPLQEGLLSMTARRARDYVGQWVLELQPTVDVAQFIEAWEETMSMAPILRTRIVDLLGQGLVQVVISNQVQWATSDNLTTVIKDNALMGLGTVLTKQVLVRSGEGKVYFVFMAHHVLYDGWSMPLLFEAAERAYNKDLSGPALLPFQAFVKYIIGVDESSAVDFWQAQLEGSDAQQFPVLPSPLHQPKVDKVLRFDFALKWESNDFTASTVVRTAWAILQATYTNSSDAVFGVTVTGRQVAVAGIERIAAPTIATVPVLVRLDGEKSVEQLLQQVQAQAIDMTPFEQIGLQRIRHISKEAEQACQFQTLLVVQPTEKSKDNKLFVQSKDKELDRLGIDGLDATTYAMLLECEVHSTGLHLRISFDSAIVQAEQVERMAQQLEHVLQQLRASEHAQTKLRDIDTASEQDLKDIWRWNATVPEAVEACVHDMIADTIQKQPDALAICAWDGELTYRQLDKLSTQLAEHLVSLGVGLDVIVPLCFEKSMWMPVAMLAVMKAGGASVALDTTQPEDRLQKIVMQLQPHLILSSATNESLATRLTPYSLVVDAKNMAELDSDCTTNRTTDRTTKSTTALPNVSPSNKLCVVFTSGSTGEPKGAVLLHSNFSSSITAHMDTFKINSDSRVFDFVSYSFDFAWSNLVITLFAGGCLCIPSEGDRKNDIIGSIKHFQANFAFFTPSVIRLLDPSSPGTLQTIVLGGEPLRKSDIIEWTKVVNVVNVYGPTECTVVAAAGDVDKLSNDFSIGSGVNTNTWIVNPRYNRLSHVGAVGELWLEGPLVGAGYLNDAEKKIDTFVDDPPWLVRGGPTHPGRHGRLHRTGDLVQYSTDSMLTFVGRKDAQVKIRGQRVELGEVEHYLKRNLDREAHATAEVVTPKGSAHATLLAFLSISEGDSLSEDALREAVQNMILGLDDKLADALPTYMIPSAYIPIARLPMTATGKTDRRRLREIGSLLTIEELAALSPSRRGKAQPPATTMEQQLQDLWALVIGINASSINANDSFLRIGGDSISAMRLVAAAREQGLLLTVADVLRRPRLCDLASVIETVSRSGTAEVIAPFSLLKAEVGDQVDEQAARKEVAALCGVNAEQIKDIYPCTPLQEGLLSMTARRAGDYVGRWVLELQPTVNVARFIQAWEETMAITPILRTRIVDLPGQGLVQVAIDEQVQWMTSDDEPPIMGLGTPLTSQALLRDQAGKNAYFTFTAHHALYDGWSMPLLFEATERAYHRTPQAELVPFQAFVKHIVGVDQGGSATEFWRVQLEGSEAQQFPVLPSPLYQPRADKVLEFDVAADLKWGSDDFTASTVVRAAWAIMVAAYTGSSDAVYGATVTGRQVGIARVDRIAGPTIATVPVRIKVDCEKSVEQLLQDVQTQAIEMMPFEQMGVQRIRRISEETEQACQFQTLLVVQPAEQTRGEDGGLFVQRSKDEGKDMDSDNDVDGLGISGLNAFTTYAMMLECQLHSNGLHLRVSFDSAIVEAKQVKRMAQQLEHVLQQLLAFENAQTKLCDIDTASEQDLKDIWRWNATVPEAVEACVHDLIAKITRNEPNAPAICAWDGELTYRQLDEMSNILAQHIVRLGVGPGVVVPLCFEKSMWMPVAMLAVMKAGGASVGLDTTHPEERLRSIVKQIEPVLILSSAGNETLAGRLVRDKPVVVTNRAHLMAVPTDILMPAVSPADNLYLVFTSGSTGVPKGVMITHSNFSSAITHQKAALKFDSSNLRVIDFISYAFDVSWSNALHTFAAGACLCIPSEDQKHDPAQAICDLRANYAFLTPTATHLLERSRVPNLQFLNFTGEPLKAIDVAQWMDDARWKNQVRVINAYGPAECTPTSTIEQLHLSEESSAESSAEANLGIGRGSGLRVWVVNPNSQKKLMAIGAVGELWLEGPLVGAGYLNDPEKTMASFLEDPPWLLHGGPSHSGRRGRLYCTGDLVQYDTEGKLAYVGRKDAQVKIRGQRVELGEVEHHVQRNLEREIQATAEVVTPNGSDNPILVMFLCISEVEHMGKEELKAAVHEMTLGLDDKLAEVLPAYMIPDAYLPIAKMPMTGTGKTDRRRLRKFAASLSQDEVFAVTRLRQTEMLLPVTVLEGRLREIWSEVLNVPAQAISVDSTFTSLGGDSISAMQTVSRCRAKGITVNVSSILRSRTIRRLALDCGDVAEASAIDMEEDEEVMWDLSPIQQMHFDSHPEGLNHYNQSFPLKLRKTFSSATISTALRSVVGRHSMLRARFQRDESGIWKQFLAANNAEACRFSEHALDSEDEVSSIAIRQQHALDISQGPVFSADVFTINGEKQILLLTGHHLVVDLVSWRIIWHDIEYFLTNETPLGRPLPFQKWCMFQQEKSRKLILDQVLPCPIVPAQFEYWGVDAGQNTFEDCDNYDGCLDSEVTALLLGSSNNSFRTEPVDILISALVHSFQQTFDDRKPPTVFLEGHGREPLEEDVEVDLSETVGWFTTLYPVPVQADSRVSALDTLRRVKDMRRCIPGNGRPYFAGRYHNTDLREELKDHSKSELLLNYVGIYQQLENERSLFGRPDIELDVPEVSLKAHRVALIDVSIVVKQSKMRVEFVWQKRMKHQDRLKRWMVRFIQNLNSLARSLVDAPTRLTLSDFPLLRTSYSGLDSWIERQLGALGISTADVQDIYPCSPIQEGIALSVTKDVASYKISHVWECFQTSTGEDINVNKLEDAWRAVVNRHSILSTIIVDYPENGSFVQVVLNNTRAKVVYLESGLCRPCDFLLKIEGPNFSDREPQHVFTICQATSGEVACRLDISHVLIDAASIPILIRDITKAYGGEELPMATSFRELVKHLRHSQYSGTLAYWKSYLTDVQICHFPRSPYCEPRDSYTQPQHGRIVVPSEVTRDISSYCMANELTRSTFLQVAWALVLSQYTGMNKVCFGYLVSSRDIPINHIDEAVGPFISMVISWVDLKGPLGEILETTQQRSIDGLAFPHISIAKLQHELGLGGRQLFNTAISVRDMWRNKSPEPSRIRFSDVSEEDPNEVR
jgi:amino acid adenylation domain-containing protein/non-ribosomal peptide synthase protein (TIGR01720 family)